MAGRGAVIWFSIFDWWNSSHGHSDIQLARELAKIRPVLFVNSMGMRIPLPGKTERVGRRILRKIASVAHGLVRPDPHLPDLAVMTLLAVPEAGRLANAVELTALAQLKLALAGLGWRAEATVVTLPSAASLATRLSPERLVYYRSDAHGAFAGISQAALEGEAMLLDRAPVVLYAARHLMEAELGRIGSRAHHLEHAVDLARFNTSVAPDPGLAALPGPRLGFFGALRGHGIDFDLLRETADALPEASLVVLGDRIDHARPLMGAANIHVLPPRAHADMPAAWAALDVALMPYRLTDWTRAIDPIKLREVLAMGVPIAAMPLPAFHPWGDSIHLADGRGDFIAAVRRAIASGRHLPPGIPSWAQQALTLSTWL